VSQDAVDLATGYLARTSPPPALHRMIIEGCDDIARALRCRARDARAGS